MWSSRFNARVSLEAERSASKDEESQEKLQQLQHLEDEVREHIWVSSHSLGFKCWFERINHAKVHWKGITCSSLSAPDCTILCLYLHVCAESNGHNGVFQFSRHRYVDLMWLWHVVTTHLSDFVWTGPISACSRNDCSPKDSGATAPSGGGKFRWLPTNCACTDCF